VQVCGVWTFCLPPGLLGWLGVSVLPLISEGVGVIRSASALVAYPVGHPSSPIVARGARCPKSALVFRSWHSMHRFCVLLSLALPPRLSGLMWSTTVAAVVLPCSVQCSHR